jgi:hypothetical protein
VFRKPSTQWVAFAAAWLFAAVAAAQQVVVSPSGATYTPGTFYAPYYGGGGGYYGGGFGRWGYGGWGGGVGSTAAGSYLTGMGNAIRAQGQFNLDTSAAAINLAEAEKRNIENNKLWTQTYFETRRINQAYRDERRRPPQPPETWVRRAQEALPDRLSPGELDPVTGRIQWPTGLIGPEFQRDREALDSLFADRALAHGAIGIAKHAEIRDTVDRMLAELKSRIQDYDTTRYLSSRKFLTSLGYEATLPTTGYSTTASR